MNLFTDGEPNLTAAELRQLRSEWQSKEIVATTGVWISFAVVMLGFLAILVFGIRWENLTWDNFKL
jgi:hypothetical protein